MRGTLTRVMSAYRSSLLAVSVWLIACASAPPASRSLDPRTSLQLANAPEPHSPEADALWTRANDVLEKRCVVCHGCYDAPCQLKLESYEGVERGGTKAQVYDASRLTAADPSRLFIDSHLLAGWRAKGFHAVLPERGAPDPDKSVLMRMLELKRANPLPLDTNIDEAFTLALDREQTCPDTQSFDGYAKDHPLWGMPYALPNLDAAAHAALAAWVHAGAPAGKLVEVPPAITAQIARWEEFFNETSPKRQLAARYIYEHLFLGSLYFRGVDAHTFFRLVRSRTPTGYAVDEIPTRRPFEDPGGKFYYRFVRRLGSPLSKTHMPYALDDARMARYRELFVTPDYRVDSLPSYDLEVSANPFQAFAALPVASRYQFMLDEAEFIMMGFIKGPVCRGQVALNVIQERFWIAFIAPDAPFATKEAALLSDVKHDIELPAEAGSSTLGLRWFGFSDEHAHYVKQKSELLAEEARAGRGLSAGAIWNGDGKNQNAALTVFRHFDSATVVKGFVGHAPKTAWVVDYPMFERIHYLLVAGFDVFGNVGHQIMTRLYMDFLRMEGESNFLALLPQARRRPLVDFWYRRTPDDVKERVYGELADFSGEPNMRYETEQPEQELYKALESRLVKVRARDYALSNTAAAQRLAKLDGMRGKPASKMPELSFVAVEVPDGTSEYFTITRESAHTNVAQLFDEESRLLPEEDELSIVPGFLGAYPNALFSVPLDQLPQFVVQVGQLDQARYPALRAQFGVSRSGANFWRFSDAMLDAYRKSEPLESGLFDYNRLEGK
ncbi:MAG TPA: fatty acid cis/trans isomerase [Polyangiales bacterium]|nr:fatty acid cis/trans isomerase [Polyangiales bacterium]